MASGSNSTRAGTVDPSNKANENQPIGVSNSGEILSIANSEHNSEDLARAAANATQRPSTVAQAASQNLAPPLPKVPGYVSVVSGATAGLVAGIVVCPLDVVKTRLQVRGSLVPGKTPNVGVLRTLRQIAVEEGVRSLYSGLTPLLVGYLPSWAIYFYVYKHMQDRHITRSSKTGRSTIPYLPEVECAVTAGACSTIATNPIWMIKTRMMVQSQLTSWRYNGVIDAARSIYKQEGIRAFYSGLSSALLGLPHVAIHFPLYEKLKYRWAPQKQWYGILAASMVSKVVASTITYPHEVIRSRNQIRSNNKYRGIWRTASTLFREEGWRVFYAGLTANIVRAIPASAVTLLTYEMVSSSLTRQLASSTHDSTKFLDPGMEVGSGVVDVVIQRDDDDAQG